MRIGIALLSVIVAASSAWAQTTAPATRLSPDVLPGLIRQLMSDDWRARDNAKSRLIDIGAPAMPALKELSSETRDEEARLLAESAMQQIEENSRLSPTLITLHIKGMPADKVWREIVRQVATKQVEETAEEDELSMPVTLDVARQPFWTVVKEISRQSRTIPNVTDNQRISLTKTAVDEWFGLLPSVCSGPVMIVPASITVNRTIHLGEGVPRTTARLAMELFIDPKFRLAQGAHVLIDDITDEKGHSLLTDEPPESEWDETEHADWRWFGTIPFKDIRDGGRRIARLSGSAKLLLQLDAVSWELDRPFDVKGVTRTVAGRRYTVNEFAEAGEQRRTTKLMVEIPVVLGDHERRVARCRPRVLLLDHQGRQWKMFAGLPVEEGTTPARRVFEYSWMCSEDDEEPAKLVIEIPTDVREITVPFEFQGLPLP